jgi:hypothetical protein
MHPYFELAYGKQRRLRTPVAQWPVRLPDVILRGYSGFDGKGQKAFKAHLRFIHTKIGGQRVGLGPFHRNFGWINFDSDHAMTFFREFVYPSYEWKLDHEDPKDFLTDALFRGLHQNAPRSWRPNTKQEIIGRQRETLKKLFELGASRGRQDVDIKW